MKFVYAVVFNLFLFSHIVNANNDLDKAMDLYFSGEYVESVQWFTKAAKQGQLLAHLKLGQIYADGKGVDRNIDLAINWYSKAAEQGDETAAYALGTIYYYGKGVPRNYEKAAKWFTKLANQGDAISQSILGDMYLEGQGLPQNHTKAAYWYKKSALKGNSFSLVDLASLHAIGLGVDHSYALAYLYNYIAVLNNHSDAIEYERSLAEKLTVNEVVQIRAKAQELFEMINRL